LLVVGIMVARAAYHEPMGEYRARAIDTDGKFLCA
jgi:hypothetical protein